MTAHVRRENVRPLRRPFQFGLGALFVLQAVAAVALSVWKSFGMPALVGVVLFSTAFTACTVGCVLATRRQARLGKHYER